MDACLEAYNLYHGTPLHVACANDLPDCVKVLLNAGECIIQLLVFILFAPYSHCHIYVNSLCTCCYYAYYTNVGESL